MVHKYRAVIIPLEKQSKFLLRTSFYNLLQKNHLEDDEPMNSAMDSAKNGISEDIIEETANSGE